MEGTAIILLCTQDGRHFSDIHGFLSTSMYCLPYIDGGWDMDARANPTLDMQQWVILKF